MKAHTKIINSRGHTKDIATGLHLLGEKIVFTNGCFDILHSGHVTYLAEAKSLGDVLIVAVNTDESVRSYKGEKRPINPLADRMAVLAALDSVDYVIPFAEATPVELIKLVKPAIYVKGGDYKPSDLPEATVVAQLGGDVQIIPFVENRSTSNIIRTILHKFAAEA